MRRRTLLIGTILSLAACGVEAPRSASPADTDDAIAVQGAFIIKPPAGRDVARGGLRISVNGDDMRLVAAETSAADRVELHTHEMDAGVMRMRQVDGFAIPDGGERILEAGGDHLMLFGFDPSLVPGDSTEMTLTLETASGDVETITITAAIRDLSE